MACISGAVDHVMADLPVVGWVTLPRVLLDSGVARHSLRIWLDGVDMAAAQQKPPQSYFGFRSYHDVDPCDYKWTCLGGRQENLVVYFEREMRNSGVVRLDYFYTTGTVQMTRDNRHYQGPGDSRRIQETYRNMLVEEFRSLLENTPNWFGKGYRFRADAIGNAYEPEYYSDDGDNFYYY